jgi:16S rRNA (guanine527-N7)-methyltransferase
MRPMPIDSSLLRRGLSALGLPSEGKLADGLERYLREIEALNPALGLVGASGDELVVKHALDSLAPAALIARLLDEAVRGRAGREVGARPAGPRIADLGTGAGLPGIPLALAFPRAEVSLVDRMTRRTDFLRSAVELLGLENARVVEEQVERVKGSWDLVVFRAFRPFERKLFKRVFALCGPDGFVLAYKGRADRARAELASIEGLYSTASVEGVEVPFLPDERCVVVMRPVTPPGGSSP